MNKANTSDRHFDWGGANRRLERIRMLLEGGGEPSPEEQSRILRERARSLAKPMVTRAEEDSGAEFLIFRSGGERYAVGLGAVSEVVRFAGHTPLPSVPPFVLGLINHRGRILPAIDLLRFSGFGRPDISEVACVIIVEIGVMKFGVAAASGLEVRRIMAAEPQPFSGGEAGRRTEFISAVTPDGIMILDMEALASHGELTIDDDVE